MKGGGEGRKANRASYKPACHLGDTRSLAAVLHRARAPTCTAGQARVQLANISAHQGTTMYY